MSLSVKKARKKMADIRQRISLFSYGSEEQRKKITKQIRKVRSAIAKHRKSQGKFTHYDNRNRDAGYLNREGQRAYNELIRIWREVMSDYDVDP